MAIFLTGATGYIGGHLAVGLLEGYSERLNLLVRAKTAADAEERLWRAWQLHLDFPRFENYLRTRVEVFRGDLPEKRFGLAEDEYRKLAHSTDSVVHCAASLNRKSERSCLNVNLRGTLEVIQLARQARDHHGLRRFSHVSTVAVAGHRKDEVVTEDEAIDWNRRDYDPYARTKKFCEHMIRELLPDVQRTIFRPSIVLGDSRRAATTQFDMVRAFVFLAGLPVLPFRAEDRIDIVPADFVADAIVKLHQKQKPEHDTYHLSSGTKSQTFRELTDSLAKAQGRRPPVYVPTLEGGFEGIVSVLSRGPGAVGYGATLLKVFLPYLAWNTVFDNARAVSEMGCEPAPFSQYCYPLLKFSKEHRFEYPYQGWPVGKKVSGE